MKKVKQISMGIALTIGLIMLGNTVAQAAESIDPPVPRMARQVSLRSIDPPVPKDR